MVIAQTLALRRPSFFAGAALTATVPSIAMAWLAAAPVVDPASRSADSPNLPAATLLNSGETPVYLLVFHTGQVDGPAPGGRLFEAIVRPTVERVLTTSPRPVWRKIDRDTGLPLLDP